MRKLILTAVLIKIMSLNAIAGFISSMDTTWASCSDSASTVTVSVEESANKIEYDLNTGNWVEVYKDSFTVKSNAISFYYKGAGAANSLSLQIKDSDGDIAARKLSKVTGNTEWAQAIVPYTSMTIWDTASTGGNAILNTDDLVKIEFSVGSEIGGSGSVAIDEIKTYSLDMSQSLLVHSYDFGVAPNELGGTEDVFADGADTVPTVTYDGANAYSGNYGFKMSYSFTNYCGYYMFLSSSGDSGFIDISAYTHVTFQVKGDAAGRDFNIELKDKDDSNTQVKLSTYLSGGTSTSFQEVKIPLSAYTSVLSTATKQITFVFNVAPKSGTVYVDDIKFITAAVNNEGVLTTIDSMDANHAIAGWSNLGIDEYTTTSFSSVSGVEGDAIQLNYSFNRTTVNTSDWAAMYRDWAINFASCDMVRFQFKGTGKANNLELKIKDNNDTRFVKKFYSITNTYGQWQTIDVPFKDLSLFEEGDNEEENIDLSKISGIYFAISKNEGGEGEVFIKNVEALQGNSFETARAGKTIKNLEVKNNPFFPDNDGIKESVVFTLVLAQAAEVQLVIYDLAGDKIYNGEINASSKDTEYSITWNGRNNSGSTVKNGMYLYRITADTGDKSDTIIQVVGVFR